METALFLVKNNVPYETAMGLTPIEAQGYCIIFSKFNLSKDAYFDYNTMRFIENGKAI